MNNDHATLADIERRTKNFADARALLRTRLQELQDEIEAAKRKAMPLIRSSLGATKAAEGELEAMITSNRALFEKPRTQIFHGIKVGIQKGRGKIIVEDRPLTFRLIRKHLSEDQVELLIETKDKLRLKALNGLSAADLKRIGVTTGEAGDNVYIAAVDSDLDKMVDALLGADGDRTELQEAA